MDNDRHSSIPNRTANKSKAESDRWASEDDTVERRDRARTSEDTEAGGITNRPLAEESANQDAVPDRGRPRDGAHAGHGDRDRSRTGSEEA